MNIRLFARRTVLGFLLLSVVSITEGCSRGNKAVVETERGKFTLELYSKDAPKTVENFRKLAKKDFFDNLTFHRVEPGFVVQGGDPKGDGTGGPAVDLVKKWKLPAAEIESKGGDPPAFYTIPEEINSRKHVEGTVGMARQPDMVNPKKESNGSQFYICLSPQAHLDGQYTVFAQVVEGMNVVKSLQRGDKITNIAIK